MLKKLRIDHLAQVAQLLPPSRLEDFKETYLSGLKSWHAFGNFSSYKENDLTSISCTFYSGEYPEWHYIGHYCDEAEELPTLLNDTIERFEAFGLKRFCWAARTYEIDFLQNYLPDRYMTFLDYKVPAWKKTQFTRHYNSLYSNQWSPVDSEVFVSILKTAFRKNK